MPSPSPSSSFSLVARDLAPRARCVHRARPRRRVDRAAHPPRRRRARTASARPRCSASSPVRRFPIAARSPRRRPSLRVGYLAQEPERRDETVLEFLGRRTGVTAAEAELERAAAALADGDRRRRRRVHRRARRLPRSSVAPTSTRAPGRCATTSDSRPAPRRVDARRCRVGRRRGRRWPRSCSSRFDVLLLDEPTNDLDFAGLDAARGVPRRRPRRRRDREPRPCVPRAHRHPGARARRAHALGHRVRRRLARLPRRARHRATARRGGLRRVPRRARRDWSNERARNANGRCRAAATAKKDTSEQDKFIRHFKVATSEKQAAKARADCATRSSGSTWSTSRGRAGISGSSSRRAPRSGDVVDAARAARSCSRGEFTLGPVDLEIGWGDRVAHRRVRTDRARRRCCSRCSGGFR